MDRGVYSQVRESESGWWYRGRTWALQSVLKRFSPQQGAVLDVGAGYGAMYTFLRGYGPVTAYEVYPECILACRGRGYESVLESERAFSETQKRFAIIGAFDVIEHMEDDVAFMRTLHTLLLPDGLLVINVPAHQFLFSTYDTNAHHFRRYDKAAISTLCAKTGFTVEYLGYWNFLLFFPAAVMRLLKIGGAEGLTPHPIINYILTSIVFFESQLLRVLRFPIGLSIIAIVRTTPTS